MVWPASVPFWDPHKTCWESFHYGRNFELNWVWTAYAAYIFRKHICGIQPTRGGFATSDARLDLGGFEIVEGAIPSQGLRYHARALARPISP